MRHASDHWDRPHNRGFGREKRARTSGSLFLGIRFFKNSTWTEERRSRQPFVPLSRRSARCASGSPPTEAHRGHVGHSLCGQRAAGSIRWCSLKKHIYQRVRALLTLWYILSPVVLDPGQGLTCPGSNLLYHLIRRPLKIEQKDFRLTFFFFGVRWAALWLRR